MTSTPALLVLLCAVLLLGLGGLLLRPRVVPLQGEPWFKAVLGGRARAAGLAPGRLAPFHPLGRWAERKVGHPAAETSPGALLPGEAELFAALAALPDVGARWALLHGPAALPPDLAGLPPAHDPARWLGPAHAGEGAWSDDGAAVEAERRLQATWVVVRGPGATGAPDLAATWAPFARVIDVDPARDGLADSVRQAREALMDACPEARVARLLLVGEGSGAPVLLRVLAEAVELRDHLAGVLLVGGVIGGWNEDPGDLSASACRDWNEAHVRHAALDTELVKLTPWMSVGFYDPAVDPPGLPGLGLVSQRLPAPTYEHREPPSVEPFDLGALPAAAFADVASTTALVGALRHVLALAALARSL